MLSDATPLFVYLVVHVLLLLYYSADDLCTHRRLAKSIGLFRNLNRIWCLLF
jgi:hypothetical protein